MPGPGVGSQDRPDHYLFVKVGIKERYLQAGYEGLRVTISLFTAGAAIHVRPFRRKGSIPGDIAFYGKVHFIKNFLSFFMISYEFASQRQRLNPMSL